VSANQPALAILAEGVDPQLLEPPANALRVTLHPDGLAPRIGNLGQYSAHLLDRLDRLIATTADPGLVALRDELVGYPGVARSAATRSPTGPGGSVPDTVSRLFVPFVLRSGGTDLTFFSTIATFGTAHDITLAELSIESFFPADEVTAATLRTGWG
jgi:hypothetical protein